MERGARLADYEIRERLGAGGMGEVYRARDTQLGREVAIKILRDELATDPAIVSRMHREARLLASLEHPRIARLYDFAEADGRRFLAMEFVDGETLTDRLERGRLAVPDAMVMCAQIAQGLDAAHLAGVIHRDLKPANVLLDAQSGAHLADFGIARSIEPIPVPATSLSTSAPSLTVEGAVMGTAPYMRHPVSTLGASGGAIGRLEEGLGGAMKRRVVEHAVVPTAP